MADKIGRNGENISRARKNLAALFAAAFVNPYLESPENCASPSTDASVQPNDPIASDVLAGLENATYKAAGYDTNNLTMLELQVAERERKEREAIELRKTPEYMQAHRMVGKLLPTEDPVFIKDHEDRAYLIEERVQALLDENSPTKNHFDTNRDVEQRKLYAALELVARDMGYLR
jgi:hypothetical protein